MTEKKYEENSAPQISYILPKPQPNPNPNLNPNPKWFGWHPSDLAAGAASAWRDWKCSANRIINSETRRHVVRVCYAWRACPRGTGTPPPRAALLPVGGLFHTLGSTPGTGPARSHACAHTRTSNLLDNLHWTTFRRLVAVRFSVFATSVQQRVPSTETRRAVK